MDYKVLISLFSVALVFVGYGQYVRDILKRKTAPHAFTFLVWSIASSITWALQVYGGAGVGAWVTGAVSLVCVLIFFLSLKYGEKSITTSDIVFLFLALFSLFLWVVVNQPVWSVVLIVLTDVLGFVPTIRKSWNSPHSETLFTWEVCVVRHGLSMFALQSYNLLTLLYPIAWTAVNLVFCIIITVRRRQVSRGSIFPPKTSNAM